MPFMAALPAITAGAGLLGKLFSGAAKGSADQRQNEYQQNLQRTQIQNNDALQRAQLMNTDALTRAQMANADQFTRAGLDLSRRQFAQNEPSVQARQAMVGSMLARLQPLQMSGLSDRVSSRMPKMNSIIDALGPEARQAGQSLATRGRDGLAAGPTQFDALAPMQMPAALNLPPATVMALQKSGLLEKIMGGLGLGGSLLGALGQLGGKNGSEPPNTSGYGGG